MTDGRPASLFVHVTDSVVGRNSHHPATVVWPVPRMYNVGRLCFFAAVAFTL